MTSNMTAPTSFDWDAAAFFKRLCAANRFAVDNHFAFRLVSSLEGFQSALENLASTTAIVAVSDSSQGSIDLDNTPHTRRVKTVFLAMRHAVDRADARARALDKLRELFRQFMSVLILEKTRLEQNCIYLDSRVSFNEIDRYFFTGCACAYFQIAVDTYTDLQYNPDEWLSTTENQ